MTRKTQTKAKAHDIAGEYLISSVEQAKALLDELRLRLVRALAGEKLTTKQLADKLGEKPTKLYHHMEVLERNGLVSVVETRIKSGIVEKYYQLVARRFRIDQCLLKSENDEPLAPMFGTALRDMFDKTLSEFERVAADEPKALDPCQEHEAFIVHHKLHLPPAKVKLLQKKLKAWLDQLGAADDPKAGDDWLLTLVFLPTGKNMDKPRKK
ncbi:MAG TPA: helix-turn-helix domain-containing protein [Candidatus Bipolaricaulota bacterium]